MGLISGAIGGSQVMTFGGAAGKLCGMSVHSLSTLAFHPRSR